MASFEHWPACDNWPAHLERATRESVGGWFDLEGFAEAVQAAWRTEEGDAAIAADIESDAEVAHQYHFVADPACVACEREYDQWLRWTARA